jgi:SecD/SecF fusion protein
MTRRRGNLFVLLFVLGLILVSGLVIIDKETKLGLDLKGGVELIYQGTPTGQVTEVSGGDIERSIEIIRERIDRLGVAEPEVSRIGEDGIAVSLPDVTNAQRAIDQVGSTAQLFFYDWEPNLLGREKVIGGNPAAQPPESAINEANKEWKAAGRSITKQENQALIFAGAYPSAYGAVKLAEEQKPEPDCETCSTNRPRYYLFAADDKHKLLAGPEFTRGALFITATGEKRVDEAKCEELEPGQEREGCPVIGVVPPGTIVVSEQPSDATGSVIEDGEPGWFALHDDPALSGKDITDPKQERTEFGEPNVVF